MSKTEKAHPEIPGLRCKVQGKVQSRSPLQLLIRRPCRPPNPPITGSDKACKLPGTIQHNTVPASLSNASAPPPPDSPEQAAAKRPEATVVWNIHTPEWKSAGRSDNRRMRRLRQDASCRSETPPTASGGRAKDADYVVC